MSEIRCQTASRPRQEPEALSFSWRRAVGRGWLGRRGAAIDGTGYSHAMKVMGGLPRRLIEAAVISAAGRRAARSRRSFGVALVYHRVCDPREDPLGISISERHFTCHMEALARGFRVTPLSELDADAGPGLTVAVTFDDGYADNFDRAFPILRRLGIPATFFIVTQSVDSGSPPWEYDLATRLRQSPLSRRDPLRTCRDQINSRKGLPAGVRRRLLGAFPSAPQGANASCFGWEEARVMLRAGMEVGSHTCTHTEVGDLPEGEAWTELVESRRRIQDMLGTPCTHLALPFGGGSGSRDRVSDLAKRAGYGRVWIQGITPNRLDLGVNFVMKRFAVPAEGRLPRILRCVDGSRAAL